MFTANGALHPNQWAIEQELQQSIEKTRNYSDISISIKHYIQSNTNLDQIRSFTIGSKFIEPFTNNAYDENDGLVFECLEQYYDAKQYTRVKR